MNDYYYCPLCPRVKHCWWVWNNLGGTLCEMPISSVSFQASSVSRCSGTCRQGKGVREKKLR